MTVLGRLKISPNQRLDLPDIIAFDSYAATDWKYFIDSLIGNEPYVLRGFEVYNPASLLGRTATAVQVAVDNSLLWWKDNENGSFWGAQPSAEMITVPLITGAINYIEMGLETISTGEDIRAIWDPAGGNGTGSEFTQLVDTETYLNISITRNNTKFSPGKIPIAIITVEGGNVTKIEDRRPLLFRLGRGGTNPDPGYKHQWASDPVGYERQDTPPVMLDANSPNCFRGSDKNIKSLKEWMDAVMSRVAELEGSSQWYSTLVTQAKLSLQQLYADSAQGHSIFSPNTVAWKWFKNSSNLYHLVTENTPTSVFATAKWRLNFGEARVTWQLGGDFEVGTRKYTDLGHRYNSPNVPENGNLYLNLVRDAIINDDPTVEWGNLIGGTAYVSSSVNDSFTGIAVGDYIRPSSGHWGNYCEVIQLKKTVNDDFSSEEGVIATDEVKYIVLSVTTPVSTGGDKYRFFKSRYSSADTLANDIAPFDSNAYWVGRRVGTDFILRDYGRMQLGEKIIIGEDSSGSGHQQGELIIEHHVDSLFTGTQYQLENGGSGDLVTIRRRKTDNTASDPSDGSNLNGLKTYKIVMGNPSSVNIPPNSQLWVRLDDDVDSSTPTILINANVETIDGPSSYYVLDQTQAAEDNWDNRDVFLLAWSAPSDTPDGTADLLYFFDGHVLGAQGSTFLNSVDIRQNLTVRGSADIGTGIECTSINIGSSTTIKSIQIGQSTGQDSITTNGIIKRKERYLNASGATIVSGSVVKLNNDNTISLAIGSNYSNCMVVLGIVETNIDSGSYGLVTLSGEAVVQSTSSLVKGQPAYLSSTVSGSLTPVAPTLTNTVVWSVGDSIDTGKIYVKPQFISINGNAYCETITLSTDMTAPQTFTLPSDSRDSSSAQWYEKNKGLLKVLLNGQVLNQGIDWEEGSGTDVSNEATINYDLAAEDILTFRLEMQEGTYTQLGAGGGGGSSSSLQEAYDLGNTITIASGRPITLMGPSNEKLLRIYGDIDVTGVIDPIAIQLTPQISNPLGTTQGLYVNTANELIFTSSASPVNISQKLITLSESTVETVETSMVNGSSPLSALVPVGLSLTGTLSTLDLSVEESALSCFGLTKTSIPADTSGAIITSGRIKDVGSIGAIRSSLYVSKSGGLTTTKPTIGTNGFVQGDYIIRVGVISKNNDNVGAIDVIVNVQIIGQV
jgi:hypothetical protein